ncbi:hypothetical protein FCK90_10990 [Kocuria coralli]|uniref:Uncharacterized protein n=1 Tax=Kocuria coralli TaxID=1461025 RepID=A0A5J5KWP4_9MICC|nr:hypothetical protein [Kocuria coralli]KAA9393700.1 hypothetical protein FCK90_10990 [Kocuria coralli]
MTEHSRGAALIAKPPSLRRDSICTGRRFKRNNCQRAAFRVHPVEQVVEDQAIRPAQGRIRASLHVTSRLDTLEMAYNKAKVGLEAIFWPPHRHRRRHPRTERSHRYETQATQRKNLAPSLQLTASSHRAIRRRHKLTVVSQEQRTADRHRYRG